MTKRMNKLSGILARSPFIFVFEIHFYSSNSINGRLVQSIGTCNWRGL